MKVVYARISTPDQKVERQLQNQYDRVFLDVCSGAISFKERREASKLITTEGIEQIIVKEVSRLGRNLRDILDTLEHFTSKGIDIYIENQGLHTVVNGKKNKTAELIISILGTIAQQERELLIERTQEGVDIAKAKGKYKGRKRGATSNTDKLRKKYAYTIAEVNKRLKRGQKLSGISKELTELNKKLPKEHQFKGANRKTLTRLKELELIQ